MSARRAVIRWAWRLFRRDWRQQLLVVSLLSVAVTVAVGGSSIVYGLVPVQYAAEFGTANLAFKIPGSEPDGIDTVRQRFGKVDVISRRLVPMPGTGNLIEFRGQDPNGPYGRPMLALRQGRYPNAAGEVAVTERLSGIFASGPVDGRTWRVVGLVENPSNLNDQFALLAPAHATAPTTVKVLAYGAPEQRGSFHGLADAGFDMGIADTDPDETQLASAVVALVVGFVAMALVCLVAAAAFVVVGRRRQRQLGMLAAIGATQKHLRLVMVANGTVVGVVAALVGAVFGVLGWMAAAPYLEPVIGARIDRFAVLPWWLIGLAMVLAVVAATIAAWWPARALSRVPVTEALSGRPSPPTPVRRSVVAALVLIAAGVLALAYADLAGLLLAAGALAIITGVLFAAPLAIRALAAGADRTPVAVRLALRDLARHQSRSSAALAAISLALGIAATVALAVKVAEGGTESGALSERQMVVTEEGNRIRELVTVRSEREIADLRARVDSAVSTLDHPVVITLEMAVDPQEPAHKGRDGTSENSWRHAVLVGDGPRTSRPGPLFVATPELLRHYGIDPDTLDPAVDVLTVRKGEVGLRHLIKEELVTKVQRLDLPAYTAAPTSLITRAGLERRGWAPAFAGYLAESRTPITTAQTGSVFAIAEGTELTIMTREGANLEELRAVRSGAVIFGVVVALGVMAMTVGLIRGESVRDLHTLAAAGATGRVRRTITATTVGALAALGALLGVAGAYLGVGAKYAAELGVLLPVPIAQLAIIALGVPIVAIAGGWLLSGRQPPALGRRVFE